MTNEEAIKILHCPSVYVADDDPEIAKTVPMFSKAYGKAIQHCLKLLDQEQLTDVEQRIFLAAMSKEEKVCKEICSYGEGVDLVAVCHSIERKVKKSLWECK